MYDVTNNTGTNVGPAVRGRRFTQRFVARDDNLAGLSLWAATYHKQIRSMATLQLLDADTEAVLRETRVDTAGFADNTWQRFSFEPVAQSRGRAFQFRFETDSETEAITLWTNSRMSEACRENGAPMDVGTICYRTHYLRSSYAVLDPLLSRQTPPEPSIANAEKLHEIIRYCVCRKEYFFLRLVHMLDALNRTEGVARVLSIGCGMGYHEAFLAARFPHIDVHATDRKLWEYEFDLPNLRFSELDILAAPEAGDYDFVFSIECLEHIPDYRTAFRNMAAKARPGGWFFLSVPFATREEQRDESLIKLAWEDHEHVLPGFDFETLEAYFEAEGYDVALASNMFDTRLAHPLNGLLHTVDTPTVEAMLDDVVRLFLLDLKEWRVGTHRDAEGVKVLGRKR
jgi:trans-aconitate methyltransferase